MNTVVYVVEQDYRMELADDGSVRIYSDKPRSKGRELSQWHTVDGYLRTKLNGKHRTIHSLVALCALGERPPGKVINHIDGNKLNNCPANLEYCTIPENIAHAIKLGLHVSNDSTRNGNYIDGRSIDRAKYKHRHYLDNRQKYIDRARAHYLKKLQGGNYV